MAAKTTYKFVRKVGTIHSLSRNDSKRNRRISHKAVRRQGQKDIREQQ